MASPRPVEVAKLVLSLSTAPFGALLIVKLLVSPSPLTMSVPSAMAVSSGPGVAAVHVTVVTAAMLMVIVAAFDDVVLPLVSVTLNRNEPVVVTSLFGTKVRSPAVPEHHKGIGRIKDYGSAAVFSAICLAGLTWLAALAIRCGLM